MTQEEINSMEKLINLCNIDMNNFLFNKFDSIEKLEILLEGIKKGNITCLDRALIESSLKVVNRFYRIVKASEGI